MKMREALVNTWSATGTTMGALSIVSVIATGSANVGAINISDGTALKYVIALNVTAGRDVCFSSPVAFSNCIVTVTSTAGWSMTYLPRP